MLRKDGEYIIYQIEEYQSKWNRWMNIAEHIYKKIPESGDCWQETGIFGFFDFETAKEYCNKLNVECEKGRKFDDTAEVTKFRLRMRELSQKTTVLDFCRY